MILMRGSDRSKWGVSMTLHTRQIQVVSRTILERKLHWSLHPNIWTRASAELEDEEGKHDDDTRNSLVTQSGREMR